MYKVKIRKVKLLIAMLLILSLFISVALYFGANNTQEALAFANYNNTVSVGDIMSENYESEPAGSNNIFDITKLRSLYEYLTGIKNATYDTVKSMGTLTANDFRTNDITKNKDIILNIKNKRWTPMYLSTSVDGDVILTLWSADTGTNAPFNSAFETNANGSSPAAMYGVSTVRAITLNNGGMYATAYNQTVTQMTDTTSQSGSEWAIYTMGSVEGSLTKFIVTPENVDWQERQQAKSVGLSNNYNNDAWSTGMEISGDYNFENNALYDQWKTDRLWLPSVAEAGLENVSGLWEASVNQRANDYYTTLRSAEPGRCYYQLCYMINGQNVGAGTTKGGSYRIRPAFHLNLTKVEKAARTPDPVQGETKKENYDNGTSFKFEIKGVQEDKMEVNITSVGIDASTTTIISTTPSMTSSFNGGICELTASDVGKYTVSVTPKTGQVWADGTTTAKEFIFYIKYSVPEPFILEQTGINEKVVTYDGTSQKFKLDDDTYDATKFTVTANSSPSGLSFDDSSGEAIFTAKDVEKYTGKVVLKNKDFMEWDTGGSTDITLKIQINARPLTLTYIPNGTWSVAYGESGSFSFTDNRANSADTLSFALSYAEKGTSNNVRISPTFDGATTKFTIPANLQRGSYTLTVTLNNTGSAKNYSLSGTTEKDFTVLDKEIELVYDDIIWQYENLRLDDGKAQSVGKWNGTTVVDVMYTGAEFRFSIDESALIEKGVKLDRYETPTATICGNNYTTTVHLLPLVESSILKTPTFTIKWKISQGLYDLSNVYWDYTDGELQYTGRKQTVGLAGLLSSLEPQYTGNQQTNVGENYLAEVKGFINHDSNFLDPDIDDPTTYIYKDGEDFPWELIWKIVKKRIALSWEPKVATDKNGRTFTYYVASGDDADKISGYDYYRGSDYSASGGGTATGSPIRFDQIEVVEKQVDSYWVVAKLSVDYSGNYEITSNKARLFTIGSANDEVKVELNGGKHTFTYDGNAHGNELKVTASALRVDDIIKTYYKGNEVIEDNKLSGAPTDAGKYLLVMSLSPQDEEDFVLSTSRIEFEIEKAKVVAKWDTSGQIPVISNLDDTLKDIVGYEYYDEAGNQLEDGAELEVGKKYSVRAILKGNYGDNYEFVAEDGQTTLEDPTTTDKEEFTVKDKNGNGNGVGVGSGNQGGAGSIGDLFNNLGDIPLWQLIVSAVSIILIISFLAKIGSCESKRKKANKKIEKYSSSVYAAATFWGLSFDNWTIIAISLAVGAVICLVGMIIAIARQNSAQDELDEVKEEYEKNQRKEDMRMMFMGMAGGQGGNMGQGGFAYAVQPGLGAEEIRGIVSETMTAMLPGMQQLLPQQASNNDELVQKLIDENAKSRETIQELTRKLSEQQTVERVVEREVAATADNDETIKRVLDNQDKLMQKILELSANQKETQIIEKVVQPQVQVIEKEVPVEKIVEKVVEVPVEKIVEKVVEKEVKVHVPAPAKPKKETAPRLTLDEAYALLSKQQQKYFDGLRQYALSKPNTKEKKSTYSITIGQSTVNPLLKLTIKKDTTVALFKMEDEYLKDIKRDASGDGTKIKVKETEVIISDAQACKAAKNMIDLREDQIERYNDLLKEQRAMNRKK